jgi:hypothetical protein
MIMTPQQKKNDILPLSEETSTQPLHPFCIYSAVRPILDMQVVTSDATRHVSFTNIPQSSNP